ncbi:hypothetical protein [Methanosarcina horonobensis]|uniref:hypothetical protein n=1 Tax=Methanosarcina horonobensis TaxID=418008 RepID=UPI00064E8E69|nr:hypothetical protein [Methanosarcina horonobensis]
MKYSAADVNDIIDEMCDLIKELLHFQYGLCLKDSDFIQLKKLTKQIIVTYLSIIVVERGGRENPLALAVG